MFRLRGGARPAHIRVPRCVRLLFDGKLSPDLPGLLTQAFPQSAHVRTLGLVGADDLVIWTAAAHQDFALATKDDDFLELAILRGAPPKVIHPGLGNGRTTAFASLLLAAQSDRPRFGRVSAGTALSQVLESVSIRG